MSDFNYGSQDWEDTPNIQQTQPEEGADITGTGADPTHHIVLTDQRSEIGFVLSDQAGDLDERTFRRFPHTDPVQPYVTEKQDSWGGGFGQATFEENRTKYWRGQSIDTTRDVLVLGPSFHYGKGTYRNAFEYLKHDTFDWTMMAGVYSTMAAKFTPPTAWTTTKWLKFYLYPVRDKGVLPTLRIRLYTDSGGEPDTLIETFTYPASDFDDVTGGTWVRVNIEDTYSYTQDVDYWVVWDDLSDGGGGRYKLAHRQSDAIHLHATSSNWTSAYGFYFRIEADQNLMNARFFNYKDQMYAIMDPDSGSNSILYMNGWRGAADPNTLSTLKDSTQTDWTGKITGEEIVKMVAGPYSGKLDDQRTVASGINGTLTMDEDWIALHTTDDEYVVKNSDYFKQVSFGTIEAGRMTDVAIADGVAYFTRGDLQGVVQFWEYNNNGTWVPDSMYETGMKAQFVQTVNDVISGDQLWFGCNRSVAGEYRPFVWQVEPAKPPYRMNVVNMGKHAGDGVQAQTWVGVGGDAVTVTGSMYDATITVVIGELTGAGVGTTGGAGYNIGDHLRVTQAGSNNSGQVTVTNVNAGEVTGVTIRVGYEGEDYVGGSDLSTIKVTGGGDNQCLVDISNPSTVDGLIAYIDLYDIEDAATTYDLRYMTQMGFDMIFATKNNTKYKLSAGDIRLILSDSPAASDGIGNPIPLTGLAEIRKTSIGSVAASLDLEELDGAQAVTSIGLNLNTGITKSFTLSLFDGIWASRGVSPITVSSVDGDNITGLETFGDPEALWVMTEAGFGSIRNSKFLPVPMREIKTAQHSNNGTGHGVSDVYLLFTWRGRLQRYFRQNVEDLGPDFPAGMGDIAGDVVDIVSYPGRIYVAVDGGVNGRSMVLCYKGGGWHEVYTSFTGERIRNLYIQPIDGKSDKLWAAVGSDLMWFPISLDAAELPDNSDYTYTPVGHIDSSWVYTGSRELDKIFRSVLLTVDDTTNTDLRWEVFFKVDDPDAQWIRIADDEKVRKSASTLEYFFTGATGNVPRGNRIRIRLSLFTYDMTKSPTIRSSQMRIYRIPEVRFSYSWITKLSSISINLRGDEEKVIGTYHTVQAAFDKLDEWAATLTPLQVESTIAAIKGKQVVLSPIPSQLLLLVPDEPIQEQSIQVQVNDI